MMASSRSTSAIVAAVVGLLLITVIDDVHGAKLELRNKASHREEKEKTESKIMGLTFVEEPEDITVTRTPAVIRCRAEYALNAWFECNSGNSKSVQSNNYVDPQTGVRIIELDLVLNRKDLAEYALASRHQFPPIPYEAGTLLVDQCWCLAYGGHQKTIISRKANIVVTRAALKESTKEPASTKPPEVRTTPRTKAPPTQTPPSIRCKPGVDCSSDLYQQTQRRKSKEDESTTNAADEMVSDRKLYMALAATTTFLFLVIMCMMFMLRRRGVFKGNRCGIDNEHCTDDGHSVLMLMPNQHGAHVGGQPDLIRAQDREKMQLISRISNFNANILDHLVVARNVNADHLLSNANSVDSGIATSNNNRSPASNNNTPGRQIPQQQQQQHQKQQSLPSSTTNTNTSGEGEADSEPDYAEPMFANSSPSPLIHSQLHQHHHNHHHVANNIPLPLSPERRPPLPSSAPPSAKPPPRHSSLPQQQQHAGGGSGDGIIGVQQHHRMLELSRQQQQQLRHDPVYRHERNGGGFVYVRSPRHGDERQTTSTNNSNASSYS